MTRDNEIKSQGMRAHGTDRQYPIRGWITLGNRPSVPARSVTVGTNTFR